ncbi:MAG: hypothetical protein KF850_34230 [Labilithrix sp.]|nr:hypothetical protein [Labilithrix sp.]
MSRRSFVLAALTTIVLFACKPRSGTVSSEAGPPSASVASAPPPIPPEPTPPQATKASEVPALEAKLATDRIYLAIWTPDRAADRVLLLTALSDIVAYGTMHTDAEAAVKKAKLGDAVTNLQKILWRVGKLPADFITKLEEHLAANKSVPRLGLWSPEVKGQPLVDATALAMWLHPNDPNYVRERMLALVKGPFPANENAPVARAWLANLGDVINRLGALGAFTKDDCEAIGAKWKTKPDAEGHLFNTCEPLSEWDKQQAAVPEWKPVQSAWDGEVHAVSEYLATTLKDPDSYVHEKCTPVRKDGALWVTECSYRAKNSFGGVVRTTRRFFLQKGGYVDEGRVVRAEP